MLVSPNNTDKNEKPLLVVSPKTSTSPHHGVGQQSPAHRVVAENTNYVPLLDAGNFSQASCSLGGIPSQIAKANIAIRGVEITENRGIGGHIVRIAAQEKLRDREVYRYFKGREGRLINPLGRHLISGCY